jgi:hypothetical protein
MSRFAAAVLAWVVACGPAVSTDDTGAGTDDGDSGNADDTGTTTTSTSTSTGTTMSTTAPSTETTAGTTAGTTVDPSACAADFVSGCQSYCAATITCDPARGVYEECVTGCVQGITESSVECQTTYCEGLTCLGGLDCASLDSGTPECNAIIDKAERICFNEGDLCSIGVGPDGACEFRCLGEVEQRLSCALGTCVCFENDVKTEACPAEDVCNDLGSIEAYADACCGWG